MTPRPPFPGYAPGQDNPVLETLLSHRSVRHYRDIPVSEAALDLILEAAQRAPTGSNMQSYSIIVVDDRDRREKLCAHCANQRFIAECGVFLVFCADISRLIEVCERQGYRYRADHLNSILVAHGDALIACQNAAVAAESMGFGTCMAGVVRRQPQAISDLLDLPRHVFATVGLAIGIAGEDKGLKPRLPRRVVVSRDRYSTRHQEEDLLAYDRTMCRSGIYHGRFEDIAEVDPDLEETFTDETYGWFEHTARRLAGDNQEEKRGLGQFLVGKGFSRE
jgi:nitroreductase